MFVRGDLIAEANALDSEAKHVLQKMTAKDAAKPSQLWKLLHNVKPEGVLWLFFTNKTAAVQHKFEISLPSGRKLARRFQMPFCRICGFSRMSKATTNCSIS